MQQIEKRDGTVAEPVLEVESTPRAGADARRLFFWLAAGHLIVDAYSGALSTLLPLLVQKFNLSLTLAALLPTVYAIMASVGQAPFGILADRFPRFNFTIWSLSCTGFLISALGWLPLYFVVLASLFVAGISTGAFHPQAAALSGEAAGNRRAFGMALFMTSGRLGYALGPLMAAPIAAYLGFQYVILLALPAFAISTALYRHWTPPKEGGTPWPGGSSFLKPFARNARPLALIWSLEALRTSVMTGLTSFLPLLFVQKGYSLVTAGASISVFVGAGAVGTLAGGRMADRIGRKRTLLCALLIALPLGYGFLWTRGPISWVLLALFGATALSTLGVTLAKAQELVPESSSTVSSLILGVTWAVGSVGILIMGAIADRFGLTVAIAMLFFLLAPAAGCAWMLPPDREASRA
ncbi:MAG: MFS transporter [Candidatus Tectomicrobia bacterium]|nr:MFS transporter [Candidatus Tectomicrobia bacterium]